MDKKKQMNFNLNNFLLATTYILDVRKIEHHTIAENHSLRVAYVSLKIAEKLGTAPKEMFDLCAYSLFYDYMSQEREKLFNFEPSIEKNSAIAKLSSALDFEFDLSKKEIENRKKIINVLEQSTDTASSLYKEIFLQLSSSIDFWLDLQSKEKMLHFIYSTLYDFTQALDFEEIFKITYTFGSLEQNIDSLLENAEKMLDFYGFDQKDRWTFLIATTMVNFGKLSIPSEILFKKGKLTENEYELLQSNIYHNKTALLSIYGFQDIASLSTRHQEKLDGTGYPSKIEAKDLSLKERLMAVLNVYDALRTKKIYRDAFSHEDALENMFVMAKNYYLDETIVKDFADTI